MSNNSLSFEFASGADSTQVQEQVVKSCSSSSSNLKEVCEAELDLADFKFDYRTDNPAVYVSSYHRYSCGNLDGMWVDLSLCADYDEFMQVCRLIVFDEEDPEFMFQDMQNWPDSWYDEGSLSEDTFERIQEFAELDEDEREAYEAFMDVRCDSDVTFEEFREAYCGKWDSEQEFTENLIDELGILDEVPEHLRRFFDVSAYSDELFRYDYDFQDGYIFRVS